MKWTIYMYPSILLIYGILMLNGIAIPKLGGDSGWFFTIVAVLLFVAIPFSNYYLKKHEAGSSQNRSNSEIEITDVKSTKEPLDYLCLFFFFMGAFYFISLIFYPISDFFLFIFVGSILFCNKQLNKFIKKSNHESK